MPCTGNHEIEFNNGAQGLTSSSLAICCPITARVLFMGTGTRSEWAMRYLFPWTPTTSFTRTVPRSWPGRRPWCPPRLRETRQYSRAPLSTSGVTAEGCRRRGSARAVEGSRDETIDWIVVQMHQDA